MKIAVIGATGNLGKLVVEEALERGHEIIGIAPDVTEEHQIEGAIMINGDASSREKLTEHLKTADVVVPVFPPHIEKPELYSAQIQNVISAAKDVESARVVGIVGSSVALVNTGQRLVESDYFQETTRHFYLKICDSIDVYYAEKELDWTVAIPAAKMTRSITSKKRAYRTGTTHIVTTDEKSMRYFDVSQISYFDFAYAIVDEIEQHNHPRGQFTVGY